jgi:sigma-B regulation protein RsbU (phosphoserine phosphatase)
MPESKSIVTRLILVITLFCATIFAGTLGYNYTRSRAILEHELEANARNQALSLANRVERELVSVSKVAEGVARSLETSKHTEAELCGLLRSTLAANPGIYGSGVAYEPYAFSRVERLYGRYYHREDGKSNLIRLEDSYKELPYLYWDWYQIPRELGKSEWSEPYFGEGGGKILMSTCSIPFYDTTAGDKHLRGVVAADISLESLTELISSVRILKTGYAALYSRNGMILSHPQKEAVMNETFFNIAESRHDTTLRELGKKMVRGESGFVLYTSPDGARNWMYYTPIRTTGWTLSVVFPENELLENVRNLSMTMAAMGFGGLIMLSLAVVYIARSITRPLRSLVAVTEIMASGNFDVELPRARSNDEVGTLTNSFQAMATSLKEYVRNLTETTAAKERIESELNLATDIQASLLPRIFPPFPNRKEFEIYASMDPAKEVGGDFYDYFFIDDHKICFLIADVADKGVPAALYMMVAKTLLKSEGQRLGKPELILSCVNNILAADNDSCMFATVFCATLDTRSGEVHFASAGHNPPLLMTSQEIRYLAVRNGVVLGPMPDAVYNSETILLEPGDTLFLYTDGVSEAKNPEQQLYGEARLLQALHEAPNENLSDLIRHIRSEVQRYANGAPQSDDITMLAITYRGSAPED